MEKISGVQDVIKFEVIRNALQEKVEEVSVALARSAYSTNIKTRLDYSCALFDKNGRIIVQAFNQPAHLGSLVFCVPAAIKNYGIENLNEGDGILINDSHRGMTHLNDIALISPLHYGGEKLGFVANVAHHIDVGGAAPGSIAATTETYQEGIIIPGVKIVKEGEIEPDIFNLVIANVRGKKEFGGDLRAQIAANKLAQWRITEVLDKFGANVVNSVVESLFEYTERRTRLAIDQFPDGVYRAGGYVVDDDGMINEPIKIEVEVIIRRGDIILDLSGSDKQRKACMNSTYAMSYSACAYPIKTLLPEDIPVNDGFYRVVKVIAPRGTVVNCEYPSPVVGGWEVAVKTTEIVFRALADALHGKVAAEGKKTILQLAFGGVDPRNGERYSFYETLAGGYGARPIKDGPDAVQAHFQNTENAPVEELEKGYPVLILRYELLPDSEGEGKFRGGIGLRRDYKFRSEETTVTILADTVKIPPKGLFGGLDGRGARYILNPDGANPVQLASKCTFMVSSRDVLSMQTPGGGGYGNPIERDPLLVLEDVRSGKISPNRAKDICGVVVDTRSWRVDEDYTCKVRLEKLGTVANA